MFPPWPLVLDAVLDTAFCLAIIAGALWAGTVAWKDLRAKRKASRAREL